MNIRHDIESELVIEQITKSIVRNEEWRIILKSCTQETIAAYNAASDTEKVLWSKVPECSAYINPMIDGWNSKERYYYAKVRVIEMTHKKAGNRFLLVYGEADDNTVTRGTDPFSTFEKAKNWFLNGGR